MYVLFDLFIYFFRPSCLYLVISFVLCMWLFLSSSSYFLLSLFSYFFRSSGLASLVRYFIRPFGLSLFVYVVVSFVICSFVLSCVRSLCHNLFMSGFVYLVVGIRFVCLPLCIRLVRSFVLALLLSFSRSGVLYVFISFLVVGVCTFCFCLAFIGWFRSLFLYLC